QMADFPMEPGDRVLAAASISFDASIEQKLLPLLRGACVVMIAGQEVGDSAAFWDLVTRHGVNYLDTTPSLLAAIIDAAPPALKINRTVIGGEEVTPSVYQQLRRRLASSPIINTYGPTECCIDATAVSLVEANAAQRLPIGRPLANYRAYVL